MCIRDSVNEVRGLVAQGVREVTLLGQIVDRYGYDWRGELCLLYTSDAADERSSVDLGGRRIIKKKNI